MNIQRNMVSSAIIASVAAAVISTTAHAQATSRHIFVANNGNLEGSVSSLKVAPDGSLAFVDKLITGLDPDPGKNPQTISLSTDGKYLCTGHGTISTIDEQLTFIEVHPDGTLTQVAEFLTPDSPLVVRWIDHEHVAVTRTSGSSQVIVYRFDPAGPSLTAIDTENTGGFNSSMAVDPLGRFLYTQDSSSNAIRSYRINGDKTLSLVDTASTGSTFPLGLGVSPSGGAIYAGGGISGGGDDVIGFSIDTKSGDLTLIAGAPFSSPGVSPKQVVLSGDGKVAIVAHGTDATMRTFDVASGTGALTSTGFSFDVGAQGDLGELAVMDNLVFALDRYTSSGDPVRGALSFTIGADGSLTQNGPKVDTQGVSPWALAVWDSSACPPDITDDGTNNEPDGVVNLFDLLLLLDNWGTDGAGAAISSEGGGSSVVDLFDLLRMLDDWGGCNS